MIPPASQHASNCTVIPGSDGENLLRGGSRLDMKVISYLSKTNVLACTWHCNGRWVAAPKGSCGETFDCIKPIGGAALSRRLLLGHLVVNFEFDAPPSVRLVEF